MLCPDPVLVVREVCRVLVPGGRFAVAVWDEPANNTFFTTAAKAIGSALPAAPPDPGAPGPFRSSAAGEIDRILRAGGLIEPTVDRLAMTFTLDSVESYWRIFTQFAAGISERLAAVPEVDRRRARDALHVAAEPFINDQELRLTATALCAVARAP
jgi:SAM-dependent methyltransferase